MKKIRLLEKVHGFPFDGYRYVCTYDNVEFISAEYYNNIECACLHLKNGNTATFNTVDYIMEFI